MPSVLLSPSPKHGEASANLVSCIAHGDPSAEAELLARFGHAVAGWLARWVEAPSAAEDLYQETFRLAIEKIRRQELREPRALAGFLRALARNLAVQHFRQRARERRRHEPLAPETPLPAVGGGPLTRLLAREQARHARAVLDSLKGERDREILARFYLLEQDKDEICRELGLGTEHFKRVLFRARERFRERWLAVGGAGRGAPETALPSPSLPSRKPARRLGRE